MSPPRNRSAGLVASVTPCGFSFPVFSFSSRDDGCIVAHDGAVATCVPAHSLPVRTRLERGQLRGGWSGVQVGIQAMATVAPKVLAVIPGEFGERRSGQL